MKIKQWEQKLYENELARASARKLHERKRSLINIIGPLGPHTAAAHYTTLINRFTERNGHTGAAQGTARQRPPASLPRSVTGRPGAGGGSGVRGRAEKCERKENAESGNKFPTRDWKPGALP
ncbi:hypothetical protein EVAR_87805_1 [Eumeta japonica]|uniref:Uncharacterized protein n=1 Tax=Eumeta variegata TaxID=151549 RepID=A0A4C1X7I1_EUMVA|nr:hypothetical protein EVAR_87805_1 [Eumeta japonica]